MNDGIASFANRSGTAQARRAGHLTRIAWGLAAAAALSGASAALAQPSLSINDPTVQPEGNNALSAAVFTVTRSASGVASSVQFRTGDKGGATPGSTCSFGVDFVAQSGSLDFAANETTKTITVTVCADTLDEPDERFPVQLLNPTGATIANPQGAARIVDDDPAPSLEIRCSSVGEGNALSSNVVCAVVSSATSGFPIRVDYATPTYRPPNAAFSAKPGTSCGEGVDFVATSGRLEIPANAPGSAMINVAVCGDTRWESNETIPVTLTHPVNAVLRSGAEQSNCTITNDDLPEVRISNPTVTEPAGAGSSVEAVLVLSITGFLPSHATIGFTCVDGTAVRSGSKTCAGSGDYLLRGGVLDLAQGQERATISVPICHDVAREGTETFQVRLSNPTGVRLVDAGAKVTILDND